MKKTPLLAMEFTSKDFYLKFTSKDFYLKVNIKSVNLRVSGYGPLIQISGPANFTLSEPVNIGLVQEPEVFKPELQHGKPADSKPPGKDRVFNP